MNTIDLIKDFIKRANSRLVGNNEWIFGDDMEIYVREGYHYINGMKRTTFDIANVEVYHKRQGIFTQFLKEVEEINPWDAVYVECVHNVLLEAFLLKQGYTWVETNSSRDITPPSFYKMKEKL